MLEKEEWGQMHDPMSGVLVVGRLVSSLGRIKAQNSRISWGYRTRVRYCRTALSFRLHIRHELVHRLVAFAFLGPPPDPKSSHVNHIDLDRGNNSIENLEYVTPGENNAHSFLNGSRKSRWDGKPVESRKLGVGGAWTLHPSISSAAKVLEVCRGNIFHCLAGRRKHTGGFEIRRTKICESETFAGEEWRKVDVDALLQDRALRQKVERSHLLEFYVLAPMMAKSHVEFLGIGL